jgi:hypothetical protein
MEETATTAASSRMDKILEEIAAYEVKLEDDPTLPSLGTKYLQRVLAQCRGYSNRVTFYHQELSREEKRLKIELKISEMDLEFKTKEMLADDVVVRQQPSIADREALAAMQLRTEHGNVSRLKVEMMDVQETLKLVKFKHSELQRTSQDIRMQRMLVKDDFDARMSGGEGYVKPQSGQDRAVGGGMPAPVPRDPIDPRDLLDASKRPDDMPEPIDAAHASMIADFFGSRTGSDHAVSAPEARPEPVSPEKNTDLAPEQTKAVSYDDLLL